jgi:alkanesulfonate monooxygenase SsuD/methylene tetrahydromethanopterin reductase-like flavin-dependent oxidoreductase (luciferase family)
MKFGTFLLLHSPDMLPAEEVYANAVAQAELADELGFDAVWLAEHHFSNYGYSPSPLMLTVKLAERTKRVRIGTAVVVLPLHHPLKLAEEIAMADQLTGGRLEVGFGRGYQEYEFRRLGVPLDENRAIFDESVEVMVKALTQDSFSHQGHYYQIPETTIFPRPLQKPHPQFWVAAQSPPSIVATVQRGYKCITGGSSAPSGAVQANWDVFRQAVEESSRGWPQEFAVQKQVYVSDTEEDARAQVRNAMWHLRMVTALRANTQRVERGLAIEEPLADEPDADMIYDEWLLFGTPDVCAEKIQRLLDTTGITYLNCVFAIGRMEPAKIRRSMELFATEVMPRFKDKVGVAAPLGVSAP